MDLPQFQLHAELEERLWWFRARRKILLDLLADLVPPSQGRMVVDVGCGTGGNTAAVGMRYRVIGIDPIPEAIESARDRFPETEFRTGLAPQDIPEIAKADAVLLMDVLEHIEDDFLFVSTLLSAMKPGAVLLMMAPADPALWSTHDKGFDHYRRYTKERLMMLWKGLEADELLISFCNSRLYPLVKAARMLSKLRGSAWGSADTDLSLPSKPINSLLYKIFAGESRRIVGALKKVRNPYTKGVSLFAIIRKTGAVSPRNRPKDLPADATPWRLAS